MSSVVMHRRKIILTKLLCLCVILLSAQIGPGTIWHFGHLAGLNFSSGAPVSINGGKIDTNEGCSVISDCSGNLLFYTDGQKVWDKNHNLMPNGSGLLGDWSSTQSSLVIPIPGSPDLYYLFTTPDFMDFAGNGLRYSIVDMTLNGGLGDITGTKNIQLLDSVSEKMTAVKHANGTDYWLVVHSPKKNATGFKTYQISAGGITSGPTTVIGYGIQNMVNRIGYLKPSPDGSRLAVAYGSSPGVVELYDFDKSTGVVSNLIQLNSACLGLGGVPYEAYGIEFSPDGNLLYASYITASQIYQFDITSGVQATIFASGIPVVPLPVPINQFGALQLGPDGKIYVATTGNTYLSVINSPNTVGMGCNFVEQGVYLGGSNLSTLSLPNFASEIFNGSATPLSLSATTVTDVSCNGANDGSVTIAAAGGSGSYTYSWNTGASTVNVSNLAAGDYTVIVTSTVGGCSPTAQADTLVVTITEPLVLSASANNVIDESCAQADGAANVTPMGGNGNYTYSWNNGNTNAQATNLVMGTYTIEVTDAKSCTAQTTVTIGGTAPIIFSNINIIDPSCAGSDGSASVTASGGGGNYTYSWSNGSTLNSISNVMGGVYTVTITDLNNCSIDTQLTINSVTTPQLSVVTSNDAKCNGSLDGEIIVSASGGQGTLNYSWSNGNTTASATNLAAGSYAIEVTDANTCTAQTTVLIGEAAPMVFDNANTTNASCNASDGSASVNVSGGGGNYTYSWSNASTNNAISNVAGGIYTVTITDLNNCSVDTQLTINTTNAPQITVVTSNDATCNGSFDGEIIVSASGGQGTLNYSWSNGNTTASATNLAAGSYTIQVTDANVCSAIQTITINEPSALSLANVIITNANCGAADGSATINPTGGTAAYTYSWSTAHTTNTITNVSSGSYTLVVTDQNGCTETAQVTIANTNGPQVNSQLTSDIICNGANNGAIQLTVSGGQPGYTYSWNNGATTEDLSNISSGTYTVEITDANGCSYSEGFSISEPPLLTAAVTSTPACGINNGNASVTVAGGISAYSYSWSNGSTEATLSGLSSGTYSCEVTDANGCTASHSATVTSNALPSIITSNDTTIYQGDDATLYASGTPNYVWTPAATLSCSACQSPIASPTESTLYYVYGTDINGCSTLDSVYVEVLELPCELDKLFIPTAFSPGDNNGMNDVLYVRGVRGYLNYELMIFNRWGEKVFYSSDPVEGWDGTFHHKPVDAGVFVYYLTIACSQDNFVKKQGNITVVK